MTNYPLGVSAGNIPGGYIIIIIAGNELSKELAKQARASRRNMDGRTGENSGGKDGRQNVEGSNYSGVKLLLSYHESITARPRVLPFRTHHLMPAWCRPPGVGWVWPACGETWRRSPPPRSSRRRRPPSSFLPSLTTTAQGLGGRRPKMGHCRAAQLSMWVSVCPCPSLKMCAKTRNVNHFLPIAARSDVHCSGPAFVPGTTNCCFSLFPASRACGLRLRRRRRRRRRRARAAAAGGMTAARPARPSCRQAAETAGGGGGRRRGPNRPSHSL